MDPILARVIDEHTPRTNKDVTDGAAKEVLKSAPLYLDEIFKSNMKSMEMDTSTISAGNGTAVKGIGLEYLGWRKVPPKEQLEILYGNVGYKSNPRRPFDIATSDFYMVEFILRFRGKRITKHLYLPYADRGNLIKISNTMHHIVPVLSDTVISPSNNGVFVRLLKDKLLFESIDKTFNYNGNNVPGQVIHSAIYRVSNRNITNNLDMVVYPPTALYLLGEFGLRETLRKYAGVDNVIVTTDKDVSKYLDTHHIYASSKLSPSTGRKSTIAGYVGHDFKVLIPKKDNLDMSFVNNLMYGAIYTLDIFPNEVEDLMDIILDNNVRLEKRKWRDMLGVIVFKDSYGKDRIVADMNDHFVTLRSYMDTLIASKLRSIKINADTFFDLIANILSMYNTWLLKHKEYNSDIENRYIDILYYLLYDIIISINNPLFEIRRKSTRKEVTEAEVIRILNNNLTLRKIYGIVKSKGTNLALLVADYSGDIIYPKITSVLEDQSRGNGVRRGRQMQFPVSTKTIRGDDLIIGSVLFLVKSAPSPRFRANMFMKYDIYTGKIIISEDLKRRTSILDTMLLGREDNIKDILDADEELILDVSD